LIKNGSKVLIEHLKKPAVDVGFEVSKRPSQLKFIQFLAVPF